MAEAEFDDMEALQAFATPDFAHCEVTEDLRFTGGALVKAGLPPR